MQPSEMDDRAYREWLERVPAADRADPIWRVEAYRLARFAASCTGLVVAELRKSSDGIRTADQLHRASWSIPANLAEGYGKSSIADRLRYYEIALGSARECAVWCAAAAQMLDPISYEDHAERLSSVRRLLLTMIKNERRRSGKRVRLGNSDEG